MNANPQSIVLGASVMPRLSPILGAVAFFAATLFATASDHVFPALGAPATRQVAIEWNRFNDSEGLRDILEKIHRAFPQLTQLYSIGQSVGHAELWCLEVTARNQGNPRRKPGMYIDGNIHGNEVQAGEVVAYTAWYLCHQYGRLDKVTELLNQNVVYLLPTINPDGRDRWLHLASNPHSSRSGIKPVDDDHDGVADEDDYDDLDGDGAITEMIIKDPHGRWKKHPVYPEYLLVPAAPDEPGEYTRLGSEGIDNDGDGKINEDPVGGYDMNRDWGWDWQPAYLQRGAREYPFSLPETRAVSEFIQAHPNIAAVQSYHNALGAILRGPGREGGNMQGSDETLLRTIAERGEKILPFYRSMITWKDLYSVWGGEIDWFYSGCGILGFTTELWTGKNLNKKPEGSANAEADLEFIKYVLLEEGAVKWHEFNHPTYGKIEIGGFKKNWGRVPPSFLLEEECHRNMAFTLYHAGQLPRLNISECKVEKLDANLYKIWVTLENQRYMPTRTAQDVKHHISPPDVIRLAGPNLKVLSRTNRD
jgi:murein tripeptide amidase MpaA